MKPTSEQPGATASVSIAPDVHKALPDGSWQRVNDAIAAEEPLEIRVNGRPVAVTMRTPGHDAGLAAGFLFTEGIVRAAADVCRIGRCKRRPGPGAVPENIIDAELAEGVRPGLRKLARNAFVSSSCGICGKASIANVLIHFPAVRNFHLRISLATLLRLPAALRAAQPAFELTGGLHAAALFDAEGRLGIVREDIGRHNAVDKVIGEALLSGTLPLDEHVLLVSGRASFEILQKSLAARIPVVAAVSAPSSLAVRFARANNQTLVGFLRGGSCNIYSHPERIAC